MIRRLPCSDYVAVPLILILEVNKINTINDEKPTVRETVFPVLIRLFYVVEFRKIPCPNGVQQISVYFVVGEYWSK